MIEMYLKEANLNVEKFGRGIAWLDTGTFESLQEAGAYIMCITSVPLEERVDFFGSRSSLEVSFIVSHDW